MNYQIKNTKIIFHQNISTLNKSLFEIEVFQNFNPSRRYYLRNFQIKIYQKLKKLTIFFKICLFEYCSCDENNDIKSLVIALYKPNKFLFTNFIKIENIVNNGLL